MTSLRQTPAVLQLNLHHVEEIRQAVVGQLHQEVCGLLAGVGGRVSRVYPVANIAANPDVSYYMDPLEQLAALKDMDRYGLDLLAVYHSHPSGGLPEPSATDIALSLDPMILHLIVTADSNGALSGFQTFRIVNDKAMKVAIVIEDSSDV